MQWMHELLIIVYFLMTVIHISSGGKKRERKRDRTKEIKICDTLSYKKSKNI